MRAVLILATLIEASSAFGATNPPLPGCPASMAEYHQFDFWIGHWEVKDPKGVLIGHSRIEAVSDGCGISERWQGMKGSSGVSYNAWDAESRHWHQFWVGNNPGGVLRLEGGIDQGNMVLLGAKANAQSGKPQQHRIIWTPNKDGSVRQHWETSDDGGKTWADAFDGIYRKEAK